MQKKHLQYTEAIKVIKNAILQSRYKIAVLANRELLSLYFGIGEYISMNTRNRFWGTGAIEEISEKLQKELPGLRGFSATNLKNMRLFFEEWHNIITNRQPSTADFLTDENQEITIRQLSTAELTETQKEEFLSVSFTHHREIIRSCNTLEKRLFYIKYSAKEFWSIEKLKSQLKSHFFDRQGKIINNFTNTLSEHDFRDRALRSFKDEYLLDFVNLKDPDEENERVFEKEIVQNVKKFIMTLGADFCFIGNQFRLVVNEEEFFIDLLFFNRSLRCLVALELKNGKFKPEYFGKMNFYLSALDEYFKQDHENPSIGIILCKEKVNKIVEFSFRDLKKPMGVATYKTASELPAEYKNILPDAESFRKLMN
ncbi:MAG TPA: PDDEXK nuclease domain-containing protein [bacterium]|nr:PDDEXK nuclease domain-containing protein [bacterium]